MSGSWDPARLPNLTDAVCEIKSSHDTNYNCIAFVAGDPKNWWWPSDDDYWPNGVPREPTFEAFVLALGTVGFVPCNDRSLEAGCDKIALYGKDRGDGNLAPTHAAIQLPDGRWASKLAQLSQLA
jgi:hypothetical protein